MPKRRSLESAGISDSQYLQIMERVAEQNYKDWGLPSSDAALVQALNDNTYNYRGYYNKYPNGKGNAVDHWTDEFKTVYHPTFSKESKYSGKKSQYNPKGLTGGTWYGEYFVPSVDLLMKRNKFKEGGIHRKIKRGDTLSKIAREYTGNAMRYNELVKLNNIANPDRIEVGQDIIIPTSFTNTIKNNELPEVVVTGHKREKKNRLKLSLEEPNFNRPEQANSLYVAPILNSTKSIEELNAPNFIESKIQDVKDVIRESGDIGDFIQTAWNGVAKHFVDDKQVKTQKRQLKTTKETPKEVLDEAFAKETRNGTDTLTWDRVPVDRTGNKYYIQESYPITDDMRFGSRNRLEYRDLDSNNAPLTTYRPIHKYENYVKGITYAGKNYKAVDRDSEGHQNHFMGYDKDGKFKIGPLSKFGPGDTMTQVYYSDIIGVPRDANGNIQYVEDRNNPGRFQPVVDIYGESTYDENGNLKRGEKGRGVLTTMSKKRSLDGSYGNVSGGRVLLQVGNETRVVAGSIEHVIQELELMQKNHKGKPVRYYQLDNGSYNRGLRTRNGKNISAQDLRDYDKQNTTSAGGGHFMYIRNKYSNGGSIHIAPSKRGTFTAAATKHGMGVQEFASRVLRNKDSYSPAMVKKANFARNASKWNH